MPARKRGGLTCPYSIQAICFVPDGHRARRLGDEPPEAWGGSHPGRTFDRGSWCPDCVAQGPVFRHAEARLARGRHPGCGAFARRDEHAEVHQQARVNLPGGPQRRRSARAGIDRCIRQPRSRVHSGDRLRAATGREGGGQCVFQRRHRATHARGGDGAGPLPSIARFRRRMHWLPAGGEPVGLRRIELPTAGWYGCCHRRRTPAVVG